MRMNERSGKSGGSVEVESMPNMEEIIEVESMPNMAQVTDVVMTGAR